MTARRVFTALFSVAALLGLALGWRVASLTEGDVIARAGADWTTRGGDPTACIALPAAEPAWIAVTCGSGGDGLLYQFDRLGRVAVSPLGDPADAARPAT
jgi:hypothetical protein